jgi:hypothetical protein
VVSNIINFSEPVLFGPDLSGSLFLLITHSDKGAIPVNDTSTWYADKYIGKKGFMRVSPRQAYFSALRQEEQQK